MTAAVGIDLVAETETGGRAGLKQSPVTSARLGKQLSTNWLRPASGNLATGLASGAPSFRSSWQTVVNAWRGVSRGTNGVESENASEAATVDATSSALKGSAAKNEQALGSTRETTSNPQSKSAVTQQNLPAVGVTGQQETWPHDRTHWEARQKADTQTTSTGNTVATATEHADTANRSRVGPASQQANQENTAPAVTVGAQTFAPAMEAPMQLPVSPTPSHGSERSQAAEATSASESSLELSRWSSAQISDAAQLPGAEVMASVATAPPSTGASDIGAATSVRTPTLGTTQAYSLHHAAQNVSMHETAASSLDDTDEAAVGQQATLLSSLEARSAESWHEQSTTQTVATGESLSAQSVPTAMRGGLTHAALGESAAPTAATLVTGGGTVQTSSDAVQESSKPFTDRAMSRTANRHAAGEAIPSATLVAGVQPASVDAAATSGLRVPGGPQLSTASAPGHQQATATAAAATTQDTFSALDAGTSLSTPAWTHAGSQHAEAGFRDPALGWVGVRADLDAGGIHATLVPSSAEAAQALNGHLAGLSTHLVEQRSPVASLTMTSPNESGAEIGMGQRMQQGAEGNPQGNAPEEAQAGSQENLPPDLSSSVSAASAQSGLRDSLTHPGALRGTHISVMA